MKITGGSKMLGEKNSGIGPSGDGALLIRVLCRVQLSGCQP